MDVITLPELPPSMSVSVVRAWPDGLVMLADPSLGKAIADFNPSHVVTATGEGLVVEVMPGPLLFEFEDEQEEGDWGYRTVTFHLGVGSPSAVRGVVGDRSVLFDGVIATPSGLVVLSDGESPEVRVPAFPGSTRVLVGALSDAPEPNEVWVDLLPV